MPTVLFLAATLFRLGSRALMGSTLVGAAVALQAQSSGRLGPGFRSCATDAARRRRVCVLGRRACVRFVHHGTTQTRLQCVTSAGCVCCPRVILGPVHLAMAYPPHFYSGSVRFGFARAGGRAREGPAHRMAHAPTATLFSFSFSNRLRSMYKPELGAGGGGRAGAARQGRCSKTQGMRASGPSVVPSRKRHASRYAFRASGSCTRRSACPRSTRTNILRRRASR